tara:strand:+ start:4304 stop:4774 length:471 start_codon:yes stop_codon:yes gene_type:complete
MIHNNTTTQELNMLKVVVKYQNTNIHRDALMGWDWLKKYWNMGRTFIQDNYSNVAVFELPTEHPWYSNNGVCEQLYDKFNRIATSDLKTSNGFDAQYIQDATHDDPKVKGFIGHTSMSVGDIVTIMDTITCETKVYFCDSVGFKDITDEQVHYYTV